MLEFSGKYTKASVMTDNIDQETISQIYTFLNQEIFKNSKIVIMPDCHKGAGTVIGFTMPLKDFVIPNMIGVDIGCGIEAYKLGEIEIDFEDFDRYLRENIPCGFDIRKTKPPIILDNKDFNERLNKTVNNLKSDYKGKYEIEYERVIKSIGTLGGGNHFIEIDVDNKNNKYLVIHSGSRNFGKKIAEFYQHKAKDYIEKHKIKGIAKGLEYLFTFEKDGKSYLEDMRLAQEYASLNRKVMAFILLKYFKKSKETIMTENFFDGIEVIRSIHNYINFNDKIIRKGAISAHKDERLIIPLNMRDGTIIGTGKGNQEWNISAPHGAGRILSRSMAKKQLSLSEFKETMKGIWSSCIEKDTIDESPMAYKPKEEILKYISDTISIDFIMKPIYNFKASDE
ncbi:MAG TPA: RtcB family protein [Spirochaetota bacterium]|nr:RtcB family protein [Spirochaetota bacterium]HOL57172.1 RtcB family protein [Spirochaetota bacterium]HPP04808.1 RtcB family protein [Spirochaetota bacterium]